MYFFKIFLILSVFGIKAQSVTSGLNHKSINSDSLQNYSFIVSGHFYGGSSNLTGFPVNTILAHLDWVNESNSTMLMSLGDIFMDVKNDIPNYETCFFQKLNIPLFNAVGNHDISSNIYQSNFGETFFYFQISNDIHIVLDTEINDGSIKDEQMIILNEVYELVKSNLDIKNVFVYTHRTIWARSYPELDLLFTTNTQSVFGNNYTKEVLPILALIQSKAQVHVFSGSLGDAPASFFNFKSDDGINYIATAIRGLKRDAVLIVSSRDSKIGFNVKSLTNQGLNKFESYDLEFWTANIGKKKGYNYRLIPLKIKNSILSIEFWSGILIVLTVFSVFKIGRKFMR